MDDDEMRRTAQAYLLWRGRGLTIWTYFAENGHLLLPGYLFYAILTALFFYTGYDLAAGGIVCFWLGGAVRDLQWARKFKHTWAKVSEFIDWDKVAQFAANPSPPHHERGKA